MVNECNMHKKIQPENIRDEISDEVIELDMSALQPFFTESAWLLVNEKGKSKHE